MLQPKSPGGWRPAQSNVERCPPMFMAQGAFGNQPSSHRGTTPAYSIGKAERATNARATNRRGQSGCGEKPKPGVATSHGWGTSMLQPCPAYPEKFSTQSSLGIQTRSEYKTEPSASIGTSVSPERRALAQRKRSTTRGSYEMPHTPSKWMPHSSRLDAPRVQHDILADRSTDPFYNNIQKSSFGPQIRTKNRTEQRCFFGSFTSPERIPFKRDKSTGVCTFEPSRCPPTTRITSDHPHANKGQKNITSFPGTFDKQVETRMRNQPKFSVPVSYSPDRAVDHPGFRTRNLGPSSRPSTVRSGASTAREVDLASTMELPSPLEAPQTSRLTISAEDLPSPQPELASPLET